jgi:hypothetical protein
MSFSIQNQNDFPHSVYSFSGLSVMNCMESNTHFSSTCLTCSCRTQDPFPTNRQAQRTEFTIRPPHNVINSSKSRFGGTLSLLTQMAPHVLNKSRLYTGPNDNFCIRHCCKKERMLCLYKVKTISFFQLTPQSRSLLKNQIFIQFTKKCFTEFKGLLLC